MTHNADANHEKPKDQTTNPLPSQVDAERVLRELDHQAYMQDDELFTETAALIRRLLSALKRIAAFHMHPQPDHNWHDVMILIEVARDALNLSSAEAKR